MRTEFRKDFLAEAGVNSGVCREFFEEEGEGRGGGVAARQNDVDQVVADYCCVGQYCR